MSDDRSIGGRIVRAVSPAVVRRRFAYKLGVLLLVVVVLLALVGGIGYVRAQQSVDDNTDRQMQSAASLQGEAVGDWITEMNRQTTVIATDEELTRDDPEVVEEQFHSR